LRLLEIQRSILSEPRLAPGHAATPIRDHHATVEALVAESLQLEVATPTGLVLRTECEWVQAPSVEGEFGILPNHLPLLAALKCGVLKYRTAGKEHVVAIGPGFIEAEPDRVELLTDLFALPTAIDVEQVKQELTKAEEELRKFPEAYEGPEYNELQRNVDWAHARLIAAEIAERA
jgi:F-type H+-transporting ATPase subunit epsilon